MSRDRQSYRFESGEQWNACLFRAADRGSRTARAGLHPQMPFAYQGRFIPARRSSAPAVTPAGEFLWHDETALLRALASDENVERTVAPWPIARSRRMVPTHDAIWVAGTTRGTLECFDLRLLSRRRVLEIEDAEVLDLAADGKGSLLVLVRRATPGGTAQHELVQVDCGDRVSTLVTLDPEIDAVQLAVLPRRGEAAAHVFLLDADHARLYRLERGAASASSTLHLGSLRDCFKAHWLASDSRARVLLAGRDGAQSGATPRVLVLDRDATLIDSVQLQAPATGVAAGAEHLIVSYTTGVSIHGRAAVASDASGISAELLTPLLTAPETASKIKWQRVDAWAALPVGTALELRYGSIADAAARRAALAVTRDNRISPAQRMARLKDLVDSWSEPTSFAGSDASAAAADTAAPWSFPLADARATQLWLHVTLRAAPRAALPSLTRMRVSYASSPLMEQLPAVYRRTAELPGDFLGALVGTLEATTQDLDRRIGSLGSYVHPDTAPVPWLDQLAEWLGVPWDDALEPAQKRALLHAAGRLAAERGTRAGLATLLACLFSPAHFRITDVDVDYGFVSLGGAQCRGSALPAVLAGLPATATVLSRKTILGRARLPCPGYEPSATAGLAGKLRIEITASPAERSTAERWLARLLEAVVPANLRLELRWHLPEGAAFGGAGELAAPPLAHLGVDAITGFARLPDNGSGTHST